MDPEYMLVLLDKFLELYNKKHNTNGSMFEDIDIKDPTMTNDRMELFYEYMQEYQDLADENKNYIDVYEPDDTIDNPRSYDIYALISNKSSKILYLSLSYMSLLVIGCKNDKEIQDNIGKDWNIVKM